jgi:glycosyltransferase involved in cell wall biosynthesis
LKELLRAFIMNSPTFDVVVPIFNKQSTLKRCLESILNQTNQPNLLVLVNDGSTDNSWLVAKGFIDFLKCDVKLIDKVNDGVAIARNIGAVECQSDFICFIDADDEWSDHYLENMASLIEEFPSAVVYSCSHSVVENGIEYDRKLPLNNDFRGYINNFFYIASRADIINSSKCVIRAQAFRSVGGFPPNVIAGEDLFLWVKLARLGPVGFDSRCMVKVHREFDRIRFGRIGIVPYPIVYFKDKKNEVASENGLREYLISVGFRHVVGYAVSGDFRGSRKVAMNLFNYSFFYGFLSLLVSFSPRRLLNAILIFNKKYQKL